MKKYKPPIKAWISPQQAAEILGYKERRTVVALIKKKKIKAKISGEDRGRTYRVDLQSLLDYRDSDEFKEAWKKWHKMFKKRKKWKH